MRDEPEVIQRDFHFPDGVDMRELEKQRASLCRVIDYEEDEYGIGGELSEDLRGVLSIVNAMLGREADTRFVTRAMIMGALENPKDVGSSEYRKIYGLIEEALESRSGDTDDLVEVVDTVLLELIEWVGAVRATVKGLRETTSKGGE